MPTRAEIHKALTNRPLVRASSPTKAAKLISADDDPLSYPKIVRGRISGWFAIQEKGDLGSGPWKNETAARYALAGDYDAAHAAERTKNEST